MNWKTHLHFPSQHQDTSDCQGLSWKPAPRITIFQVWCHGLKKKKNNTPNYQSLLSGSALPVTYPKVESMFLQALFIWFCFPYLFALFKKETKYLKISF